MDKSEKGDKLVDSSTIRCTDTDNMDTVGVSPVIVVGKPSGQSSSRELVRFKVY